ncbi:MAG: phosphomannomutase/phosphoglucomutase [Bacteroidales bacterium]
MNWKKLQNGSDIRGVALEGVKGENVNLTPKVVTQLGKAFITWLNKKGHVNIIVAVGMDSRISGASLKKAIAEGIVSMGGNVVDCGIASTPAMFMTTKSSNIKATAGVMLTASHLPYNRNGLKFFTAEGGLDKRDISEILTIAERGDFAESSKTGDVEKFDFISEYATSLVTYIRAGANSSEDYDRPLKGAKIIVDAGNGAGGFFASKVLEPLGADTEGSQFLKPDGRFPNHVPNPEDAEAMNSICKAVVKHKADLGIIFDTDVDRAAVVDRKGNPVNRNDLIALISAVVLKEHPESIIVTDSITSDGLTKFIEEELKGVHHRFKRGYKNVIDEAIRLNSEGKECHLAIETSGHAALKENYFLDDGAYLVAKLLVETAHSRAQGGELTDLIGGLKSPAESREFRFSILKDNFSEYGNEVIEKMVEKSALQDDWEVVSPNYEGIRVRCGNDDERGWYLLRLSLHDPVMPLNIESDIEGGVNRIASSLKELLQSFRELDVSGLDG